MDDDSRVGGQVRQKRKNERKHEPAGMENEGDEGDERDWPMRGGDSQAGRAWRGERRLWAGERASARDRVDESGKRALAVFENLQLITIDEKNH